MIINSKNDYIPVLSVIIVTFNQEVTISQTIESVLDQKCNFIFEIIIGEDCGIDRTREICIDYQNKFPEKIKLILFEQNGGIVNNWVNCVRISTGKYITTCAGDDYWHNINKLQIQYEYMESHSNCGVLHSDFNELNILTNKTIKSFNKFNFKKVIQGYVQKEVFNGELRICAPTICFRKELIDKHVPLDKYLELKFPIEDWPTYLILSHYSTIDYIDISTVTYRKGHESISNQLGYQNVETRFNREKEMYKYLCNLFPDVLPFDEKGYDLYVTGILLNLAYKKLDYSSAHKYAKEMLSLGAESFKVKCSLSYLTFCLYGYLKRIR